MAIANCEEAIFLNQLILPNLVTEKDENPSILKSSFLDNAVVKSLAVIVPSTKTVTLNRRDTSISTSL